MCSSDLLYELKIRGIVPIIVHPERYAEFIKRPTVVNNFIDEGALFQLDACSIDGVFGKEVKETAKIFLKNNIYSFIGSDAHNTRTRTSDITKYKDKIDKVSKKFINESIKNGEKLIKNQEIKFKGKKIKEKNDFFFSLFIS